MMRALKLLKITRISLRFIHKTKLIKFSHHLICSKTSKLSPKATKKANPMKIKNKFLPTHSINSRNSKKLIKQSVSPWQKFQWIISLARPQPLLLMFNMKSSSFWKIHLLTTMLKIYFSLFVGNIFLCRFRVGLCIFLIGNCLKKLSNTLAPIIQVRILLFLLR